MFIIVRRSGAIRNPNTVAGTSYPGIWCARPLTACTAERLQKILSTMKQALGLNGQQAVAYLVQVFLFLVEIRRGFYEGKTSILHGPTWGQLIDGVIPIIEARMKRPVWRLESVLDFWDQFGERFVHGCAKSIDRSLSNVDYVTIPPRWLPLEVPQKPAPATVGSSKVPVLVEPLYVPLVQTFVEYHRTHVQTFGPLTIHFNSPVPECLPAETSSPYVFRREGEFWTIIFNGRAIRIKDRKGLQYMAHLLRDPGREYLVTDLVQTSAQPQPNFAGHIYGSMSAEQLDKEHLRASDLGDAGTILGTEAKMAYKRQLDDLRGESNEAIQQNDLGRATRARAEIEAITDQLVHATGLGGKDRKAASAAERARLSVTKAI